MVILAPGPNMRRIVILGKTGSGKSSVANTIFEEDKFTVCHGSVSAESPCEAKTKSLNGKEITLIDTPGLFDTNKPEEALKPEIVKCITECSPGPHAFLIVLQLGRFTEQENDIVNKITQYFSEEVFRFATVVFTHGDDLREGQKITEYLSPNVLLDELVKKCGGRCHVIDNKYWKNPSGDPYRSNAYQVKEILKSVEEIVKANNGNCYTNEMLQVVEKLKQQEKQRIAQSSRNLSEREIDEKAKSRVCDILARIAAGITAGVLLGALFGVVAAIGAVIPGIKIAADLKKAVAFLGITAGPAAGVAAGTAAEATIGAAAGTAAEATTGATAGTASITAGSVLLGTFAAAGAAFGAYKGYQAAEEAETPWEAAKKTAEALWSSGKHAKNKVEEFSTKCQKLG
ncbi:PREDICTED: GTPase IMAP family member 7-like [Poecilia mexicana]|uniref:GTPase IMAP family member 7-like n=1 Tax=Poecilia mexicana TaxID=48701 RepID=UPI00072DDC74|nr:PREDICTED: GTPase IMAP family member 7-like [Poecilia mexicana]